MKSWIRGKKALGLLAVSLALLIAAGCQALNGVDFNAMLKQSLGTSSFEGSTTIEIKLLPNDEDVSDEASSAETEEMLDLLSDVKLQLDEVKSSEAKGMSAKGSLSLGELHIPFEVKTNNETAELVLAGARQPIRIQLTDESAAAAGQPENETLAQAQKQVIDAFSGYAVDNMPNPVHLSVLPGQESVNGSTLTGMNVHAELKGTEILDWFKSYLTALIADKDGLEAMLTGLLEAVQSQSALLEESPADSLFGSLPEEDKSAAAIDDAVDQMIDALTEAQANIAKSEQEDPEGRDRLFNDGVYVKGDLFLDGKLDIRKAVIEAGVTINDEVPAAIEENEDADSDEDFGYEDSYMTVSPFKGLWMKITTERWNVNGDVQPEAPSAGTPALDAEKLGAMEGYEVLRQFDSGSDIYHLLREQAHISKQTVMLNTEYGPYQPIVTPGGIALVPLRYAAEAVGAQVLEERGGGIRVLDGATNTDMRLKKGGVNAIINGKTVAWRFPLTVVNDMTYVPARDFANAIGAQVSWEQDYDSKTLILVREP
ncbi:copper amine oxidase N-terminal domain-containing protein [Paenibacillus sacheonensis]|uniref:Copper amine oxidase-like N-terminal domain-containing protein n=1 Tax=Paenibacillus sacheonensis TaxID=742054 RepID=A0A7X4YNX4_9BACL|nr:copper amine oxidase N-terminal domain-containing protein [Paenibacillus sacheonensis]MBM7567427.1 hypothetical protein [Paenibacillus sacheonensis]NBC69790.1 hypothetical protein [Paenibacillus sacheonensis]